MKNKGEIGMNFLVGLIFLLIGFAILLFFYFQLSSGGNINKQVCHQSIILRATLPSAAQGFVPLKCNTEKICITGKVFGKGECTEFNNEKSVKTVRVGNDINSLNKIQKIYSQEILGCWSMMGEGKVSLFNKATVDYYGYGDVYPTCVICSRVAIDKDSLTKVDFSKMDLFDYMNSHLVPEKDISYLQLLSGKDSAKISIDQDNIQFGKLKDSKGEEIQLDSIKIEGVLDKNTQENSHKETAILFMQISSPEHWETFRNTVFTGGVAAGGLATTSIGRGIIVKLGQAATSTPQGRIISLALAAALLGGQQLDVAYDRAITASYCNDIEIGSDARSGCSVVRTINYNAEDILKYCQVIESIP